MYLNQVCSLCQIEGPERLLLEMLKTVPFGSLVFFLSHSPLPSEQEGVGVLDKSPLILPILPSHQEFCNPEVLECWALIKA